MEDKPKDDLELVFAVTGRYLNVYLARGKSELSAEEAEVLGVWMLDAEVNNGGFDQYFWNTAGDLISEAIEGLENIGADDLASIAESALAELPDDYMAGSRERRRQQLDELQASPGSRLSGYDTTYYNSKDDPICLLAAYMRENGLE
jgi:hypothetical protein